MGSLPLNLLSQVPTSHQHPSQVRGLNVEGQVIQYQLAAFDLHVRGANLACYLKKKKKEKKKTELQSGEQRHFAELLLSINERRSLEATMVQQGEKEKQYSKVRATSCKKKKTAIAKSVPGLLHM